VLSYIPMKDKIHSVIFDLDGTLSDSAILTVTALQKIAPLHGLPVPSEEAIKIATGNPNPEFYYLLFPGFPRETIAEIGGLVEEEELRILPSVSGRLLFKGCREMLECLKEQGIRLHIASTGDRDHVFSVLGETGIAQLFDSVSCERPVKTEMLREIIGDDCKDCFLMVGDMHKDHEAARANGILSVGACYGYCTRNTAGFDYYIDAPDELLKMLH